MIIIQKNTYTYLVEVCWKLEYDHFNGRSTGQQSGIAYGELGQHAECGHGSDVYGILLVREHAHTMIII